MGEPVLRSSYEKKPRPTGSEPEASPDLLGALPPYRSIDGRGPPIRTNQQIEVLFRALTNGLGPFEVFFIPPFLWFLNA
jgi:hypothetical protein